MKMMLRVSLMRTEPASFVCPSFSERIWNPNSSAVSLKLYLLQNFISEDKKTGDLEINLLFTLDFAYEEFFEGYATRRRIMQ